MAEVEFGIIACSSVARRRFLPALKLACGARLARIGSRDLKKAARYAYEFDCPQFGDYESVLADPAIHAVYISTPPTLHAEWVYKAAAAGKHVLCEKPAFFDGAEAQKTVDTCRLSGVLLLEGYAFKYHPQHALVRDLITSGRIGTPRFFTAEVTYPRPPEKDIRLNPRLGGGVFHDSAGYPVSAAMLQIGAAPISVSCTQGLDPVSGVDDTAAITLTFSSGVIAQLYVAYGVNYRSRYSISGTLGRIDVERAFAVPPDKAVTVVVESAAGVERIDLEPADQFRLMTEDFCSAIKAGFKSATRYENDILRQQSVMDALALSVHEQRTINIEIT